MQNRPALTDRERFPLLNEESAKLLRWLREHPHAPKYNYACGDCLTEEGLARVRAYEKALRTKRTGWVHGGVPPWLKEFAQFCVSDVPFYRRRVKSTDNFFSLPLLARDNILREPWSFVPDSQPLDGLIVYSSTGTTGRTLIVLSHPEASSVYLALLRAALEKAGVRLEGGDRVSLIVVCAQNYTYTFPCVSAYLGGAGFVKINLNPAEWRGEKDPARFLDACRAEIYSGDPVSFKALSKLPLKTRPKALVSTAMTLLSAVKDELETRFECPVIDFYSMIEARLIGVSSGTGFEIFPHDVYVEILDNGGKPCKPGARGEIVITGCRSPFLPLLRYRTGDFASLNFDGGFPVLENFEGRLPVVFTCSDGKAINNIDITHALQPLSITQFSLHQFRDGSLVFKTRGAKKLKTEIQGILKTLFGSGALLSVKEIEEKDLKNGKLMPYTSEL